MSLPNETEPRSKWLNWKPKSRISRNSTAIEPTEASKLIHLISTDSVETEPAEPSKGHPILTTPRRRDAALVSTSSDNATDKPTEASEPSVVENSAESELAKPTEPTPVTSTVFPEAEPSKVSEPAFLRSDDFEVEVQPDPVVLRRGSDVLARAGVRIMAIEGGATIGVWSDLDGPQVRAALRTFGSDQVPVRYLDGDSIPMKYKLRRVPGEPVPINVLAAMEQEPNQPWVIRDRMLEEMGWRPNGIPWAEWKAQSLNKLFLEQGVTGEPGRIKPATVLHGERRRK
jgi:hypothetical protein